ncbi:MAG: hypothetical protein E7505_01930 [Ruminococcus sp.]|nr:hypothetical protein [Ruminococcus sp.]
MNRKIFIFIISAVSLLSVFSGCRASEETQSEKTQDNSVLIESDAYFCHSTEEFPENLHIMSADVYNNELYYIAEYHNRNFQTGMIELDDSYEILNTYDIGINEYIFEDVSFKEADSDIFYNVYSDEKGFIKLVKYDGKLNKSEKTINIYDIPEKIWSDKNHDIFLSYADETGYTIEKYTSDFEFAEEIQISGLPEHDEIYELRYIEEADLYGCFIDDGKTRFALLNSDFEYLATNSISLNDDEHLGYIIKDSSSVCLFEKNKETEYSFYEVSLDTCDVINTMTVSMEEPYSIYDSFEKYSFLAQTDKEIIGYSTDYEKFETVYDLSEMDVTDIKVTSQDKIEIYTKEIYECENKVFTTNNEDDFSAITYDKDMLYDFFMDNEGSYYFLYRDMEDYRDYIIKKDKSNNIEDQFDVCSGDEIPRKISVSDGAFCVLAENSIDSSLNIYKIEHNETEKISINDYDILSEVYIYDICYCNGNIYMISSDKIFEINEDNEISLAVNLGEECNPEFIYGPEKNDFYFTDNCGVYRYKTSDKTIFQIADWDKCDLDILYKNMVYVLSDDEFNVIGTQDINDKSFLYRFKKSDGIKDMLNSKKEIKVAGVNLTSSSFQAENFLTLINKINNTSDDIKITVINYDDTDSMHREMVAGNSPDIIYTASPEVWSLKLLSDLSPLMMKSNITDDEYYVNLFKSDSDDTIKNVFSSVSLYTMIGKEDEIGKTELWSADEYIDLIEQNSGRDVVMEMDIGSLMDLMFIGNLNSYIDYQNNTVSIDNEGTYKLMNSVKKLYNGFDIDDENLQDRIDERFKNSDCYIDLCVVARPEHIGLLYDFVGSKVSYKGIPSSGKCSPVAEPDFCLGILETSSNKEEAWSVIEQIFTDDFQSEALYIPLKHTVFREEIELNRGRNLTDEEIDNFEKLIEGTSTVIFKDQDLSDNLYSDIYEFINGDKTAEETAESIQKKVTFYVNELK